MKTLFLSELQSDAKLQVTPSARVPIWIPLSYNNHHLIMLKDYAVEQELVLV